MSDTNPQVQYVSHRQGKVLSCVVPTSLPPASILWERNSAALDEPDFSSGQMGVTLAGELVISSVDATSFNSRFYCYASNDIIGQEPVLTTAYLLLGNIITWLYLQAKEVMTLIG